MLGQRRQCSCPHRKVWTLVQVCRAQERRGRTPPPRYVGVVAVDVAARSNRSGARSRACWSARRALRRPTHERTTTSPSPTRSSTSIRCSSRSTFASFTSTCSRPARRSAAASDTDKDSPRARSLSKTTSTNGSGWSTSTFRACVERRGAGRSRGVVTASHGLARRRVDLRRLLRRTRDHGRGHSHPRRSCFGRCCHAGRATYCWAYGHQRMRRSDFARRRHAFDTSTVNSTLNDCLPSNQSTPGHKTTRTKSHNESSVYSPRATKLSTVRTTSSG
jgi:hypothetical protein